MTMPSTVYGVSVVHNRRSPAFKPVPSEPNVNRLTTEPVRVLLRVYLVIPFFFFFKELLFKQLDLLIFRKSHGASYVDEMYNSVVNAAVTQIYLNQDGHTVVCMYVWVV